MKPVLFIDFDGTLCHDKFWRSLDLNINKKIQEYLFGPDNRIVNRWMKGGCTSEDINLMLSKELDVNYEILWSAFVRDCETMLIEPGVIEKIYKLRQQYKTILITDNMDCLDRFTVPALGLDKYFDQIVNSYYEKTSKNDDNGKLFKKVSENNSIEIKNSILLDNSKGTCEIFSKLGGISFFVTKEKPLVYWLDTL